jgi:GNAT superfamily N-acetyltransferase
MGPPPKRTFVAVGDDGAVVGSAVMGPNHGGPASRVSTASFMVDRASSGRGAGRALGERVLAQAREDGYRAMRSTPSLRATSARWPSGVPSASTC